MFFAQFIQDKIKNNVSEALRWVSFSVFLCVAGRAYYRGGGGGGEEPNQLTARKPGSL
jgi:hypothetical protein